MSDQLKTSLRGKSPFRMTYLEAGLHVLVTFYVANGVFADATFVLRLAIYGMVLLSVGLFILAGFGSRVRRLDRLTKLMIFYLVLLGVMATLRSLWMGWDQVFTLVANPRLGMLIWFAPLISYLALRMESLASLYPVFTAHAVVGAISSSLLLADVIFFGAIGIDSTYEFARYLYYGIPFLLFGGGRIAGRRWPIYLLALLMLATFVALADRTFSVVTATLLLLAVVTEKVSVARRRLTWMSIASIVMLSAVVIGIIAIGGALSDIEYQGKRLGGDTRSFLVEELFNDLSPWEVVFGRGALGTYYSPFFNYSWLHGMVGDSPIRQVNEIGYLHIVLKLGMVGLVGYFSIAALAISRGLRNLHSESQLACLMVAIVNVLLLLGKGWQLAWNPYYVVYWLSVGVLVSHKRFAKTAAHVHPQDSR